MPRPLGSKNKDPKNPEISEDIKPHINESALPPEVLRLIAQYCISRDALKNSPEPGKKYVGSHPITGVPEYK